MKAFVILLIVLLSKNMQLCAQDIVFTYSAGSLAERKMQIVIGPRFRQSSEPKDSLQILYEEALSVFPNPTSGNVNIQGRLPNKCGSSQVTLYNSAGSSVYSTTYYNEPKSIDLGAQSRGVYFLEFRCLAHGHTAKYKIITTE